MRDDLIREVCTRVLFSLRRDHAEIRALLSVLGEQSPVLARLREADEDLLIPIRALESVVREFYEVRHG